MYSVYMRCVNYVYIGIFLGTYLGERGKCSVENKLYSARLCLIMPIIGNNRIIIDNTPEVPFRDHHRPFLLSPSPLFHAVFFPNNP